MADAKGSEKSSLALVADVIDQRINLLFGRDPVGELASVTEAMLFCDEIGRFGNHFHPFCWR